MPVLPCPPRALGRVRYRYADRVHAVREGTHIFTILIDGHWRFQLEGDSQWPAQWRLYAVNDGAREGQSIAMESECWDIIEQLERGVHWMPAASIEPESRHVRSLITYARYPNYLDEK